MKNPIRIFLLALLCLPVFAAVQKPEVIVKNADEAEFRATPIMPSCFRGAMQRFEPSTGRAVFLVRSDSDGCTVPWHWHSSGEQITVVSGVVEIKMKSGQSFELKEGGFAFLPSKHIHLFGCHGACVHFVQSEGPYDIHYVNKTGREITLEDALKALASQSESK